MRYRKPLTNQDGEVRELLLNDLKRFRPIAKVLPPSLLAKLGIRSIALEPVAAGEFLCVFGGIKCSGDTIN